MDRRTEAPLRCATAGSVDDGKSTLLGRLLLDAKALMTDQIAHVEKASERRGLARTDLALVTDGLRAEREQGITIDVAWRYFATPRRRFVLADSPGHVEYTRNMVTACSQADAIVVLVDARHYAADGSTLLEQTRRHLFVARMLGVRSIVIAVNKMDAVGYSRDAYARAREAVVNYLASLPVEQRGESLTLVPVSALVGDNVVVPSRAMPWYQGPTLLSLLESLPCDVAREAAPARLAVQWVIRPQSAEHPDYRGYAGRLSSGTLRVGQPVRVLPSGRTTRVTRLETPRGDTTEAVAGESIVVHLEDDVDVSRGDCIVAHEGRAPTEARVLTLDLAWVNAARARVGATYLVKHTTREVRAILESVDLRYDVTTGRALDADAEAGPISQNDLARVRFRLSAPLYVDPFADDRTTGSVLVIDPATAETLAGGMCV